MSRTRSQRTEEENCEKEAEANDGGEDIHQQPPSEVVLYHAEEHPTPLSPSLSPLPPHTQRRQSYARRLYASQPAPSLPPSLPSHHTRTHSGPASRIHRLPSFFPRRVETRQTSIHVLGDEARAKRTCIFSAALRCVASKILDLATLTMTLALALTLTLTLQRPDLMKACCSMLVGAPFGVCVLNGEGC